MNTLEDLNIASIQPALDRLEDEQPVKIPDNSGYITLLAAALIEKGCFPVILLENEIERENIYDGLISFFGEKSIAYLIPRPDPLSENGNMSRFKNQLHHFISGHLKNNIAGLCSSREILDIPLPEKESLRRRKLIFRKGQIYEFDWIINLLENEGYSRTLSCEHNGEYAVRGGIIDLYPFGHTYPLRLDFFGEELDSIRVFNPGSQLSSHEQDLFEFIPSISDEADSRLSAIFPVNTVYISENILPDTKEQPWFICCAETRQSELLPFNDFREDKADETSRRILQSYRQVYFFYDHEILVEKLKEKHRESAGAHFINRIIHDSVLPRDKAVAYINCNQLFHVEHMVNPDKHFIPDYAEAVDAPSSLKYADYVVHSDYGIGRFTGIETLETNGVLQDAFVLEFQNNDKVYVALKYIGKIFKYSSSENYEPKLSNLRRGGGWEGTKRSARKSIREIAKDLLSLYSERHEARGFAFHTNEDIIREIERSFPYTETPDQKKAIFDIYKDMESTRIMDRLVCGDVGFGKTEVAVRAAFKAILSGKQIAVLVPTTILSIQHHESFNERLGGFGIRVEIVNRFRRSNDLKTVYKDSAEGKVDVLIGTHKLLSGAVNFKDLGLLIIDEEHRFGVRDKEKIKQLRKNIDVMTMTATPIPRTLEFSLMGLRDISKIETPPRERIPILTKIMFWEAEKIARALKRELSRNGQSIIVSNDINTLKSIKLRIAKLIPEARIEFAHGQMKGPELEKKLIDFYHHEYDILIATTIIESGIDIPNANTLVVFDAHNFGLSQLYQIRGRVGRSHRKAYAYLIIPRNKRITPAAEKRLRTLEHYTDLGSGYHIAMRDLEIRGSGNLFGTVQSGFINNIGFEYYLQLLNEEIESLKSGFKELQSTENAADINLNLNAYIPDSYISNTNQKLDQYRQLSRCRDIADMQRFRTNIIDRYGRLPKEVDNLLLEKHLGIILMRYKAEKLLVTSKEIIIHFPEGLESTELQKTAADMSILCQENELEIYFSSRKKFSANIPLKGENPLTLIYSLFPELKGQKEKQEYVELS